MRSGKTLRSEAQPLPHSFWRFDAELRCTIVRQNPR
jgi:hypothetical protein